MARMPRSTQFWTIIILFLTMLFIFWQSYTAYNEYKAKNKPVVGIEEANVNLLIPEGDPRTGKPVSWDLINKNFICDGKIVDARGCIVKIKIKNFGTEPALDFNYDLELLIGNKSIKTKDENFKNCIIMPGQVMFSITQVSKDDLINVLLINEQIRLKFKCDYSNLTKKQNLFQYYAEIVILDKLQFNPRIINAYFKDRR